MTADNTNNKLKIPFTGERFTPETRGNVQLEHQHRYLVASQIVEGKVVVDIASGEGYGSDILSKTAKHVYGIDIDPQAIEHAKKRYNKENITFLTGNCVNIPLDNDSVDVIISFETLEHIVEQDEMLLDIKRILHKDGILIMSTPIKNDNALVHHKFHVKELYQDEFNNLVSKYFKNVNIYFQDIIYASLIYLDKNLATFSGYEIVDDNTIKINDRNIFSKFSLALASDAELPNLNTSILEPKPRSKQVIQNIYIVVSMLKLENIFNKLFNCIRYIYKKITGK
ncbi:MAG: class I SAM-dependent methyltransferase [Deltaproteobacteria bacterium]|jgi:2-polyprenyl-3-methyl-5-hydroxy-6-metoxy-1,4-benzoquinol methylase|nr:class I SAM-dependent methyltransferase [Deltaproteobacteria bacterium]